MRAANIFLLLLILLSFCGKAQTYRTAGGLRLSPDGFGLSGKQFLDRGLALESVVSVGGLTLFEGKSITLTGLVEYHIPFPDPQLRLFFGGGAHGGYLEHRSIYNKDEGIFGFDGIGGIEYLFRKAPLGLSLDFKPAINFLRDVDYLPHNNIGIAIRYLLQEKPKRKAKR